MIKTREMNPLGLYYVQFYIRGKPWVVAVDDIFTFLTQSQNTTLSKEPFFITTKSQHQELWAPLIEKAYAKVKGNYMNIDGDFVENGLRAITGLPVYRYDTLNVGDKFTSSELFEILKFSN